MTTILFDRFQIVDSYPALYDPENDAVIISDLHLGLESLMAKAGTYMPKFQLSDMKEDLQDIVEQVEPERIIVCGDIKHEFSETSYGEREEVQEFIEFLAGLVDEILLVKGNHDNFLIYYVQDYDNVELEEYFVLEDVLFLHGHELIDEENEKVQDAAYVVMGHEHPSLALQDKVGVTEKIHCFLYGEMINKRKLIVLPAFSGLAQGTPMNRVKNKAPDLLSPILKEDIDVSTMKAVGVDKEAGAFEFPQIGKI